MDKLINGFFDLLLSLLVLLGFCISVLIDLLLATIFETKAGRWFFVIVVVGIIVMILKHC